MPRTVTAARGRLWQLLRATVCVRGFKNWKSSLPMNQTKLALFAVASLLVHTRSLNLAWITGARFCPPLLGISSSREWEQHGIIRRTEKAMTILSLVLNSGIWQMWCALPSGGNGDMSTPWDWLPKIKAEGKHLKAQAQGQAGRGQGFWALGVPAGEYCVDKVMLTATAGARTLPTVQGRAPVCSLCWTSSQQGQKDISLLYPAASSSL